MMAGTRMCLANKLNFINEGKSREIEKADYSSRNKQTLARSKIVNETQKKKKNVLLFNQVFFSY